VRATHVKKGRPGGGGPFFALGCRVRSVVLGGLAKEDAGQLQPDIDVIEVADVLGLEGLLDEDLGLAQVRDAVSVDPPLSRTLAIFLSSSRSLCVERLAIGLPAAPKPESVMLRSIRRWSCSAWRLRLRLEIIGWRSVYVPLLPRSSSAQAASVTPLMISGSVKASSSAGTRYSLSYTRRSVVGFMTMVSAEACTPMIRSWIGHVGSS
jgi:hypothetical protein